MKVKLLVSIVGLAQPRYGLGDFAFQAEEESTLHPELAAAWIQAGYAVPVTPPEAAKAAKKGKK